MGIINWIVQHSMRKEANRVAKECRRLYDASKVNNPDSTESELIRKINFNDEEFYNIPENSRIRFEKCCETIQGFCYMIVLDLGKFKGWMNFRSLQFTYYMDKALESQGFPPQTKEQKGKILEVMGLRIPNWDKITGD
ncbi:hypothetical protein [Dehalococcoides mccartyi]|uniref:hypothetical protein n=1 Tax=Dehalococcoides mccartyi TaxID=61435 RepID=UPI00398AFE99